MHCTCNSTRLACACPEQRLGLRGLPGLLMTPD